MQLRKSRILCFNSIVHALRELESLCDIADVEVVSSKSRQEFFRDLHYKYRDIDAIYRTSQSGAVRSIWPVIEAALANISTLDRG